MDKTKSKLAAFFDNDDEEHSFPQKVVDGQKLSQYTQGTVRKSKREKEQEAAAAKKREEEEEAAKVYAEYMDTYGEGAEKKKAGSTFVKAGQQPSSSNSSAFKGKYEDAKSSRMFSAASMSPPPTAAPKPKGKRAMDSFLEEIKREQADREARLSRHATHGRTITSIAAYEGQSGSKDRGDPETSNLFVAHLPQHVTEQSLGTFFARYGPVGSVKIMWPRGDITAGPGADMTATRLSKNTGLSGFVAFMKRKDAEAALRELDGFDWGGSVLRVGWSKAVPVATKAKYTAKPIRSETRSRSVSRSRSRSRSPRRPRSRSASYDRHRSRSRSRDRGLRSSRHSRSRSWSRSRSPSRSRHHGQHRSDSRSRRYGSRSGSPRIQRSGSPFGRKSIQEEDEISDAFIRTVAVEVRGHGVEYEHSLRERERSNPRYDFLHRNHRRYKYFRSLVDREDTLESEFFDDGYHSIYSTDSAEESERERVRKTELGKLARRRFEAMLRGLSGRRGELARCMAFSLDHAEAAAEISDIIIASLVVDGTPVPRKVARLHLICDILHNSAAPVPMAWKFRQEFQSRMGLVFDHLSTIYHSFPGRITAETFKKQIISVVDIWDDWIVFPPDFTAALRARLEGSLADQVDAPSEEAVSEVTETVPKFTSKFTASSFKPAEISSAPEVLAATADDDGEPMDVASDVDGEPVNDDLDGVPMDDVDGVPMDDLDGEAMGDVDGEPLADVDGEAMDDDIDGAPVEV